MYFESNVLSILEFLRCPMKNASFPQSQIALIPSFQHSAPTPPHSSSYYYPPGPSLHYRGPTPYAQHHHHVTQSSQFHHSAYNALLFAVLNTPGTLIVGFIAFALPTSLTFI